MGKRYKRLLWKVKKERERSILLKKQLELDVTEQF